MDIEQFIKLVSEFGIGLALFVPLLIYVLKKNDEREKRYIDREERYISIIETFKEIKSDVNQIKNKVFGGEEK